MLAGLLLTAAMVFGLHDNDLERAHAEFVQRSEVRSSAVTRGFNDALGVLRASNALFVSVGPERVGRDQFAAFVRPLLREHPYIRAVQFHRMVGEAERAAFEAARAHIAPGFAILEREGGVLVPAAHRARYLVVDYLEPQSGNKITFGYDALSFAPQAAAFERAIATGAASSTVMLPLLQNPPQPGVVIAQPLYRPGAPLTDALARRAAALGDTAVVLDVFALVGDALAGASLLRPSGLAVELVGPGPAGPQVAFRHDTLARRGTPAWHRWLGDRQFVSTRVFAVAGQRWELRMVAASSELTSGLAPAVALALGLLATLATAAFVQGRAAYTRRIEKLAAHRTADLHQALDALRLYRRAIDASANAVILVSATRPGYPIEYVNPAFERMRGYTAEQAIGKHLLERGAREPDQAAVAELRAAIRERREGRATMRLRCRDGRLIHADVYIAPVNNDAGELEHFVVTQYDISTAKRYEAELEARARFDTLTGLPNRALLHDRIDSAINYAAGRGAVWVVALDLDNFKYVNDMLGHEAGDRLLRQAGARIASAIQRTDTVARTGGDEFVLVLPGRATEGEVIDTVSAVREALAHPLELSGQQLVLTGSAGVAAWPADGGDAATLIQHAEVAMYRAKELGRNLVQFYTPAMNARARERLALEGALRSALLHDQFELYYQPQVDLESGSVVGLEALIRWRHPRLGLVYPDRFINLAEETGLIVPIGAWVLRTACHQNRAWQHAGYGPLRIGVNLSARQFAEPGLVREIERVLDDTGLAPGSLEIEITESLVMDDVEGAIRIMCELKRMGVKLSMDDFGTGHSSLSYLRRFPVDVLKIDRSFLRDIPGSEDGAALVAAIIELARGLRMRTIAEGVETQAQLDYLRRRGCDEVQGHVYAQAVPGVAVEAMLRTGRRVQPVHASA
jgi:diguanylate cyclase (GGDEF)-like protein/PAS domain S-box-containing protein